MDPAGIILIDPQDIPMRPGPSPEEISSYTTLEGACPGAVLPRRGGGAGPVVLDFITLPKYEDAIRPHTPAGSVYDDRGAEAVHLDFFRGCGQQGWVLNDLTRNQDLENADEVAFPHGPQMFTLVLCVRLFHPSALARTNPMAPSSGRLSACRSGLLPTGLRIPI